MDLPIYIYVPSICTYLGYEILHLFHLHLKPYVISGYITGKSRALFNQNVPWAADKFYSPRFDITQGLTVALHHMAHFSEQDFFSAPS